VDEEREKAEEKVNKLEEASGKVKDLENEIEDKKKKLEVAKKEAAPLSRCGWLLGKAQKKAAGRLCELRRSPFGGACESFVLLRKTPGQGRLH